MKNYKRIIAGFLTFALLFSILPAAVFAAESEEQATVDTGNVTIEGTNSFGTLLSEEITQEQESIEAEADQYEGGYSVTDLIIEGSTATVTYDSLEEATLLVALYTEDGLQMLSSATTAVSPDATEATVTFEGEMPEYFLVSAYLLDTYDLSPLCAEYSTPMYTQEMQELLASTVSDYDADRVLNLDDDETTNFAVYADDTIVIEAQEGVNTVVSVDEEARTYVIENADEQFMGLAAGDVFAYQFGEESMLIAKVFSIAIDGSTVTIIGDESIQIEEVFTHLKIEDTDEGVKTIVDDSTASEGVTYVDSESQTYGIQSYASEGSVSNTNEFAFDLDVFDSGEDEKKFEIIGSLAFSVTFKFEYYISSSYQHIEYGLDFSTKIQLDFTVSSKESFNLSLGEWRLPVIVGLSIKFKPAFVVDISASLTIEHAFETSFGGYASHANGQWKAEGYYNEPKYDASVELEGELFIGFELTPAIEVLYMVDLEIKGQIGIKFNGEVDPYVSTDDSEVSHECKTCIAGTVSFVLRTSIGMEFAFFKNLSCSLSLLDTSWKLSNWYCCLEHSAGTITLGTCPHKKYRLTIEVLDTNGLAIPEAVVEVANQCLMTNEDGVASIYLSHDDYSVSVSYGDTVRNKAVLVDEAKKLQFNFASVDNSGMGILGTVEEAEVKDHGKAVISGNCGADGDNLTWNLYPSGLLEITGSGDMADYSRDITSGAGVRWYDYRDQITEVSFPGTLTSIGSYTFWYCDYLTSIDIPASVVSIGAGAFYACNGLTVVDISENVTAIGNMTFASCENLQEICVDENNPNYTSVNGILFDKAKSVLHQFPGGRTGSYEIPEGIAEIKAHSFLRGSISSVIIPASVTKIGRSGFANCLNLEKVIFKGSTPTLGASAFDGVTATIYYPAGDTTWDSSGIHDYSGITCVPYTLDENGAMVIEETVIVETGIEETVIEDSVSEESDTLDQVYGGDYSTEVTDTYILKTASFTGLVPGEEYVLLAMVSITTSDPLAADNLLYVDQATALEDGTLSFRYVQRESTDTTYVMACGASNRNLADATITFPEMTADGELQVVDPEVVYDGVTLTEGQDYVIIGTVDYTEAGTYTCYIRGIHNYTGLVECTYAVLDSSVECFDLSGTTMSLGNSLAINFVVNTAKLEGTNNYAVITKEYADGRESVTVTVPQSEWVVYNGNLYYFTFAGVSAKEMNDNVTVVVYNGAGQQMTNIYVDSVAGYSIRAAQKELAKTGCEPEKVTLYVDMVNYGAAAQIYFGYDEANLANAGLTDELKAYASETVEVSDSRVKGEGYLGTTLSLKNEILLNFVFSNAVTENAAYAAVSFTNHYGTAKSIEVPAENFQAYGTSGKYISVTSMSVADCYADLTVTLYDAEGNVITSAVDSVESYIARTINSNALYPEIMKFANAAYNYFH